MQNRRDVLAGLAAVPVLGSAAVSTASANPSPPTSYVDPPILSSALNDGRRAGIKAVQYYVQRYLDHMGFPAGSRDWYVAMNDAVIHDIGIFFGAGDLPSFEMVEVALRTPMSFHRALRLNEDMHHVRIGRDMALGWDALSPQDQFDVRSALIAQLGEGIRAHRQKMLLQGFRAITLMPMAILPGGASREVTELVPCWWVQHRYIALPLGQEALA